VGGGQEGYCGTLEYQAQWEQATSPENRLLELVLDLDDKIFRVGVILAAAAALQPSKPLVLRAQVCTMLATHCAVVQHVSHVATRCTALALQP
jgi:hypothetical protein